jgi:RNA polymerase sigma-70 factor, ECF subfamily
VNLMPEPSSDSPLRDAQWHRDVRIFARMASGDHHALRELYSLYSGPLFSFALRSLGDVADAEEAVQDCFVRLWRGAGTFDSTKSKPFTWAHFILRSLCIDRLRKRGRRIRTEQIIPFQTEAVSAPEIMHRDEIQAVLHAMDRLTAAEQAVINLAIYQGYSRQEIAVQLDQPISTIKSRLQRSLTKLRMMLPRHE